MTPLEVTGYGLSCLTLLSAVGIFVEPSSSFPLGRLSSFLHATASTLGLLLSSLIPKPVLRLFSSVTRYLFHRPNPVFQVLYFILVLGGYALFLLTVRPLLPPHSPHHLFHFPVVVLTCLTFIAACYNPPLHITPATHPSTLSHYATSPLFLPATCPTCSLVKPARSKHCSVCSACIHRFDHHCIWINQCVGWGNHRHFLLFLACNAAFTAYASVVLSSMLRWVLWQSPQSRHFPQTTQFYLHYTVAFHSTPLALLMVSAMLCVLLSAFTAYNVYLACLNVTTNEAAKYSDLTAGRNPHLHLLNRQRLQKEEGQKLRLHAIQREMVVLDPKLREQHSQFSAQLMTEVERAGGVGVEEWVEEERKALRLKALFKEQDGIIQDINAGRAEIDRLQQEEEDRMARGEGKVEVPNVYDRGWWRNLMEVLKPDTFPLPVAVPQAGQAVNTKDKSL